MRLVARYEYEKAKSPYSYSYCSLHTLVKRIDDLSLDSTYTIVGEDSFGYWVNFNKSKNITRRTRYCMNDFTLLRECADCGKVSTPKKIQNRHLYGYQYEEEGKKLWDMDISEWNPMLCMGCYNKRKPYHDLLVESEELRLAAGRLQREIYKRNKIERERDEPTN